MAYRLRMPAEIGDWLTELAGSQPEAAAETVATLLALMSSDAIPGPPLVTEPDEPALVPADPREELDQHYQQMLEVLQHVRREVADVSTTRRRTEIQLSAPDLDPAVRPVLERQLEVTRQLVAALMERGHRLQLVIDRFRTGKEAAKALATAAEARALLKDLIGIQDATPEAEDIDRAASQSAARVEQLLAEARRLLTPVQESARNSAASRPETDVLELRSDPLGSDARILFAEEPIGTVTLLTALEDADAVDAHRDMAIDLAGELLAEMRDEGWPTDCLHFEDPAALIARFFPGRERELTRRAATLGTAMTPAGLRERAGLAVPELAERAGLSESVVASIETHGARHADAEDLAAYARAAGATLRLTVEVDGTEHIVL